MNDRIISTCDKCGSAVWLPRAWHSVNPPAARYTCTCSRPKVVSVAGGMYETTGPKRPDETGGKAA